MSFILLKLFFFTVLQTPHKESLIRRHSLVLSGDVVLFSKENFPVTSIKTLKIIIKLSITRQHVAYPMKILLVLFLWIDRNCYLNSFLCSKENNSLLKLTVCFFPKQWRDSVSTVCIPCVLGCSLWLLKQNSAFNLCDLFQEAKFGEPNHPWFKP